MYRLSPYASMLACTQLISYSVACAGSLIDCYHTLVRAQRSALSDSAEVMGTARAAGVPMRGLVALEVKVDSLGQKLDMLLSGSQRSAQPAACAYCSACTAHAKQQEAILSMLSTQADRLHTLERLVPATRLEARPPPTREGGVIPSSQSRATPSQEGGTIPEKPLSCRTPLLVRNSCGEAKVMHLFRFMISVFLFFKAKYEFLTNMNITIYECCESVCSNRPGVSNPGPGEPQSAGFCSYSALN